MDSEQRFRILIVDRSGDAYRLLQNPLQWNGYYLENATETAKALNRVSYSHFDLVLIRDEHPEIDGIELLDRIKKSVRKSLPVILLVDQINSSYAVRAIRAGVHDVIEKPDNPTTLLDMIRKQLQEQQNESARKSALKALNEITMSFSFQGNRLAQPHIASNVVQTFLGDIRMPPAAMSTLELCLDEMVQNALIHGILQIKPDERHQDIPDYNEFLDNRFSQPEMKDHRIDINCSMQPQTRLIRIRVSDTGAGFDFESHLKKDLSVFSLEHIGRGITFIRTLADSVSFEHGGRTIIIEKHFKDL